LKSVCAHYFVKTPLKRIGPYGTFVYFFAAAGGGGGGGADAADDLTAVLAAAADGDCGAEAPALAEAACGAGGTAEGAPLLAAAANGAGGAAGAALTLAAGASAGGGGAAAADAFGSAAGSLKLLLRSPNALGAAGVPEPLPLAATKLPRGEAAPRALRTAAALAAICSIAETGRREWKRGRNGRGKASKQSWPRRRKCAHVRVRKRARHTRAHAHAPAHER